MIAKQTETPIKHGTIGAYNNRGCRCDECTTAWRSYHNAYMHGNAKQRKIASARSKVIYWRNALELREYRRKNDPARYKADGLTVSDAKRSLRDATAAIEELKSSE